MHLLLTQALLDDIQAHLRSAYPNEGGGFMIGKVDGEQRLVTEVRHVKNVFEEEEQFHRYLAENGVYERLEDEADTRGLSLLGYYHSHPNSPAIPSEFDRVHAWPFFAYLIISVHQDSIKETRLWSLKEDRSMFDEGQLTISGS